MIVETARQAARRLASDAIKGAFVAEMLHHYKRADGTTIYWRIRCRLSNGDKWIRPMHQDEHAYKLGEPPEFKVNGFKKPLYGLDELAKADPAAPVWVVEGEAKVDALRKLGIVATTAGGATSDTRTDFEPLRGRTVILWPDNDEPGKAHMQRVGAILRRIGCAVETLTAEAIGLSKHGDVVDWVAAYPNATAVDLMALPRCIDASNLPPTLPVAEAALDESDRALTAVVERLASMPPLRYEQIRDMEAKSLGVRVPVLDEEVKRRRNEMGRSERRGLLIDVEPWPSPVAASLLLDEVETTIHRFIVCEQHTAVAASLWCAFTWLIEHVHVAPIALITAPEKRCGKSLMLELIGLLSRRQLVASNISPAAVFRVIEAHAPTLLIDEADAFLKDNEELRGVINSGHTRAAAFVIRTVGDDHEPRQFSTWSAKAIAGIGNPAPTIMDRSIVLELRRKLPTEQVERLRHADGGLTHTLARKLARLAQDFAPQIERARPVLPPELHDRAQDNWEPLLAIADAAGGNWPMKARAAALALSYTAAEATRSTSAQLLADIRDLFETKRVDKIRSADLIEGLCADDESGWSTYNRGKPITFKQLATKLKDYGIHSKSISFGVYEKPKGFERRQFEDSFRRYLSDEAPLSPATPATSKSGAVCPVAGANLVAATEIDSLPQEPHECSRVAGSGSLANPLEQSMREVF